MMSTKLGTKIITKYKAIRVVHCDLYFKLRRIQCNYCYKTQSKWNISRKFSLPECYWIRGKNWFLNFIIYRKENYKIGFYETKMILTRLKSLKLEVKLLYMRLSFTRNQNSISSRKIYWLSYSTPMSSMWSSSEQQVLSKKLTCDCWNLLIASLASETKASFAALTTSLFWMLFPSPIIFPVTGTCIRAESALLLASLQRNWLIYFSCSPLFFTCFSTGGLTRFVMQELLNLERDFFLWLEDDISVQLCSRPWFSFSCFGVESATLGWKALVEKSMLGSRTENMSPSRSWSTWRWRCNSFSTDFWVT